MLFTITRDQYNKYKDTASYCRQYILDKYPRLCSVVNTFSRYFSPENIDIYADGFKEKSLLLTLIEDYEESCKLAPRSIEEYLNNELDPNDIFCGIFVNLAIYVHWPSVIVTNEHNQSVVVNDLFAKVPVYTNGVLREKFRLSRATYSYEQYSSGYLHSHVPGINQDPSIFMKPCLGSGPLIRTQETLMSNTNEEYEDLWDLFCVELDRYVHVESVAGVPYRYLSKIGTSNLNQIFYDGYRNVSYLKINTDASLRKLFNRFFKYVLTRKKMRFGFSGGVFTSAYSKTDWILKLSKEFIKYTAMLKAANMFDTNLNELIRDSIIIEAKVNNGVLYDANSNTSGVANYLSFEGKHVLYFRGEDIKTHVESPLGVDNNVYYVLNPVIALGFLDQCLNYLNIYEHEKSKHTIQEETEVISGASDSDIRTASKNTFHNHPINQARISVSL